MKGREALELRQLRHFVTLAEELNFRRAAERLFISQPSLSHQIVLLEGRLGVRLFRRDRRGVSLTQAGTELLEDARRLLAESEAILEKAQAIATEDGAILHVGYPEFANRTRIPAIFAAFRDRHPEAKLHLSEGYSRQLIHELRQGRLDVGFVAIPSAEDLGGLEVELVVDEPTGLVLAAGHQLANLAEIPVEMLAEVQLLLADRSLNPRIYDLIVDWFHASGVEPRFFTIGPPGVYTYDTAMRVIESGEAVSLTPEYMLKSPREGIVFRPIRGSSPHFQIGMVWSGTNRSATLTHFLEVAKSAPAGSMPYNRSVQLTA